MLAETRCPDCNANIKCILRFNIFLNELGNPFIVKTPW